MKRSYLLIYTLGLLSLIFLIVLSLTNITIEESSLKANLVEDLALKYAYESAANKLLASLNKEKINFIRDRIYNKAYASNKYIENIDYGDLKGEKAVFEDLDGLISLTIGSEKSPYRVKLVLDPFYKEGQNEFTYEAIVKSLSLGLKEEYKDYFKTYNDVNFILKAGKHYIGPYDQDLAQEEDHGPYDKDYAETEDGSIQESKDEEGFDDEAGDIKVEEFLDMEEDSNKDKDEGGDINNLSSFLSGEIIDLSALQVISYNPYSSKNYLILGPKVRFTGNIIQTMGILYLDEDTKIEGRLIHRGIALVDGQVNLDKGSLKVEGGLYKKEGASIDNIEYKDHRPYIIDVISKYEESYNLKVLSYTID